MGDSNSNSPIPTAGLSKLLLPNPELTTLKIESGKHDLGEPECYYFEEYEAPRMNPSVVAAHKRIGLLQKFNKWQGKAIEKMQKSMDKMVSKIKSLEKKVSGSSSKKKKSKAPTFPRSRSLLTTPKETPCPRASQSLFFRAKGRRRQHAEKEEDFKARRSSSTTGLDRVQTEETQLDRAEGRAETQLDRAEGRADQLHILKDTKISHGVIVWVLSLHKVHGEESIVVLLVHGELILLLLCLSLFHWLILVPLLVIFINQLVHLFSFLITLSFLTAFLIWRAISPS
ncbi:unnamed protein product [Microthlaspi erraticum]|uniref:Arabidopsis retrotransposon Orf1 C-terminal domain-containing protein n=1 Tax=Microthlaspi erraticum TaxID=1685480 RepID=A0A6D2K0W3_9BRAS|nr:unnamed protein product [Microthlaspi erraticum]